MSRANVVYQRIRCCVAVAVAVVIGASSLTNVAGAEPVGRLALAIERALKRAGGVSKVDFDGKAATVIVQFDPAQTSTATIQKTITEAGFPAKLRAERG